MDRSNIATLVKVTTTYDDIGQIVETETTKQIYCNIRSIGMSEFFKAGERGFKPRWVITCFAPDYENEQYCIIDDKRYKVYRTYIKQNEELEIYLESEVGVSNA